MSDLTPSQRSHVWLLNDATGEVYPLGPMYGTDPEYARRKLERERLSYPWVLLAPAAGPKEDE